MTKILFVCLGNICRSPMAEYVFKKLIKEKGIEDKFEVASCATSHYEVGNDIYPPAKEVMKKNGVPFSKRQARQITKDDMSYFDYIVVMDQNNMRDVKSMFPGEDLSKVHLLMSFAGKEDAVSDPYYTRDFDRAYQDILEGCTAILNKLENK